MREATFYIVITTAIICSAYSITKCWNGYKLDREDLENSALCGWISAFTANLVLLIVGIIHFSK